MKGGEKKSKLERTEKTSLLDADAMNDCKGRGSLSGKEGGGEGTQTI